MRRDHLGVYAETFELLASSRRLHALFVLRERGEPVAVPALAEEIADREHRSDDTPEEVVDRVSVGLWHAHVPKLRESGVLAYDSETDRVELSSDDDAVERVLDVVFDEVSGRGG